MNRGLKVFNAISAIVFTLLLWYAIYIYFFVEPIVWLGNIIMFYMNFSLVVHFIGLFMNDATKKRVRKQKFFHWSIDVTEMFILAFLFAAFGWWYYAIISAIMFMFIIEIYKED